MSSDGQLQLNLTTSKTDEASKSAKRKSSPEPEEEKLDKKNQEQQPKKKKSKSSKIGNASTNEANADDQPFISSLFNNNPQVPKLELSNEGPKATEEVFSDKSIHLESSGVHPYIAQTLKNLGMESLTLVQSLSIPLISAGFDCLIKSQTGSGKTLAYAIPMLQVRSNMLLKEYSISSFIYRKYSAYTYLPIFSLILETSKCKTKN